MADVKLNKKLKFLIEHRATNQAELARKTGFPEARISEWVRGKGPALARGLEQGLKIARALDVSVDYLADEAAEDEPDAVPSKHETQVREIAGRMGWEWIYWRLVGAERPALDAPSRPDAGHERVNFVVEDADIPAREPSVDPKRGRRRG